MVLEKTLESPLEFKEIPPVHPKEDQSWVFIGRTDIEAETPILWPPDVKSWLIWKDPDAGKDSGQEEKGTAENEMVGWHHWLDRHGFGWTLGFGDGQGGLVCCGSWGRKEKDTTEQLNWTELNLSLCSFANLDSLQFHQYMSFIFCIFSLYFSFTLNALVPVNQIPMNLEESKKRKLFPLHKRHFKSHLPTSSALSLKSVVRISS